MLLNTLERVVLLGILPREDVDWTTLKVVHDLKLAMSFTEEEHKELSFREEVIDGRKTLQWNPVQEKDFEIGDKAKEIILNELIKLSKKSRLREDHFTLCGKFNLTDKLEELKKEENDNTKK